MGKKEGCIGLIFLVLFIFNSIFILGQVSCSLDKETYYQHETALFKCSCTDAQEENKIVTITWKNSTGDTLKTSSANSDSCLTNFMIDTYTFLQTTNFTGNVTVSGEAKWVEVGDVNFDNFTFIDTDIMKCRINNFKFNDTYNLGQYNIGGATVYDLVTGDPLVGVSCKLFTYDVTGIPVAVNPTDGFRVSCGTGCVMWETMLDKPRYKLNTTYVASIGCHCSNVSKCYLQSDGSDVGFKTCQASTSFRTGNIDYRKPLSSYNNTIGLTNFGDTSNPNYYNYVLLMFVSLVFIFILLTYMFRSYVYSVFFFNMIFIMIEVTIWWGYLIAETFNYSDGVQSLLIKIFQIFGIISLAIMYLISMEFIKSFNKKNIEKGV